MFKIEFASIKDLEYIKNIANIYNIPFPCDVNKNIFMTAIDDKPFGYISVNIKNDTAIITGHAVLPEYRNKGYGTILLRVILNNLYNFGIKKANVDFSAHDDFYISNGFEITDNGLLVDLNELFKK